MRAVPSEAATQAHQHLQHELRSTGSDWKEAPVLQVGPRIRMGTDHQICGSLLPGLVNEAKHVQAVATMDQVQVCNRDGEVRSTGRELSAWWGPSRATTAGARQWGTSITHMDQGRLTGRAMLRCSVQLSRLCHTLARWPTQCSGMCTRTAALGHGIIIIFTAELAELASTPFRRATRRQK